MNTCPACEQPASTTIQIEMGDRWADTVGKPPHSLFSEYRMLHVAGQTASGELVVYCHSESDLQQGPPGGAP